MQIRVRLTLFGAEAERISLWLPVAVCVAFYILDLFAKTGPMSEEKTERNIDPNNLSDEARGQIIRASFEAEATRAFGPPDVRQRKNHEHVKKLTTAYTERVVRQLLKVLSEVKLTNLVGRQREPVFAQILRRHDLDHDDLGSIIRKYDLTGPRLDIISRNGSEYRLEISGGWGDASECWEGDISYVEGFWSAKCTSYFVT